jgi:hypothetical protein
MSAPSIEALTSAWAQIAEEAGLPADYEGTATPEAHRVCEAIFYTHEEVMLAMQESIDRARDKPC